MWSEEDEHRLHYEVSKRIFRYARAVDRRDWELLTSVFHRDARIDYGFFEGGVDDTVRALSSSPAHVEQMMHTTGNILLLEIDREGRRALVESHCLASQKLASTSPTVPAMFKPGLRGDPLDEDRVLIAANRYVDIFSERDGELRIEHRRIVYEWFSSAAAGPQGLFASCDVAKRGPEDPSFAARRDFLNLDH